jgi:hypothetical protein
MRALWLFRSLKSLPVRGATGSTSHGILHHLSLVCLPASQLEKASWAPDGPCYRGHSFSPNLQATSSSQTTRIRPVLKDLSSISGLHILNDELAEAIEADRAMARMNLYNLAPELAEGIEDGGALSNPLHLKLDMFSHLTVRFSAHPSESCPLLPIWIDARVGTHMSLHSVGASKSNHERQISSPDVPDRHVH